MGSHGRWPSTGAAEQLRLLGGSRGSNKKIHLDSARAGRTEKVFFCQTGSLLSRDDHDFRECQMPL